MTRWFAFDTSRQIDAADLFYGLVPGVAAYATF
jgi:hypothetical protein